jgi:hypothetical protein
MFDSPVARFLLASVFGLTAAGVVLGIAAGLDGAFFTSKQGAHVTPCYFTAPAQTAATSAPGMKDTATGCLVVPEQEGGLTGLFYRLMSGGGSTAASPPILERPPTPPDRRP